MNKKALLLSALLIAAGGWSTAAAQVAPGRDRVTPKTTRHQVKPKRKPSLRAFLGARVTQIEWDDVALSDVVDWLRDQSGVNVVVRWKVLAEKGIDEDTPVSLKLKNVRVTALLREVLGQLSTDTKINYVGLGNMLVISTRDDLNRKLYVKVYSVDDLIFAIPDYTDAPQMDIQQLQGGGGPGGGSATQNPFQGGGGGGGQQDTKPRSERIAELIEMIKQTIEPEAWRENGGESSIKSFNDRFLVVRAPLEVHEKLGGPLVFKD